MPLHKGQILYIQETLKLHRKKNILTCANRWGKSVTIACLQIWYLFYKRGLNPGDTKSWQKTEYRTANIAPHSALTEPVFKTIHQILTSTFSIRTPDGRLITNECLIGAWYLQDRTLNTPPYKQFFDNNSYIEHRSLGADQGDSLQGKPYGLITYDEGGRSDHLEMELTDAILPRLFDWNGPLHILSTPSPSSKSNLYYYQLYQEGTIGLNNTYTQTGSLKDNTFFGQEQIQDQYDLYKDDPMREQVLEGKFIFGGNTLFDVEAILECRDETLDSGIPFIKGHKYAIGTDTAIGSDELVHKVLDYTKKPYLQVAQIASKGNSKSPQRHLDDFINLFDEYNQDGTVRHLLETWNGESVRFYEDLPPYIQSVTDCYGSWQPHKLHTDNDNPLKPKPQNSKKAELLITLKKLLAAREVRYPKNDKKTVEQLSIYREKDDRIPTDRVFALAMACYEAEAMQAPNEIAWVSLEW